MKKVLIVIDMQNDFVTGALANPDAQDVVRPIADMVRSFDGTVIATRDTHGANYLTTQEGRLLPVAHCIQGTPGWEIVPEIARALQEKTDTRLLDKPTFGMPQGWHLESFEEADVVGTCTDICVVSNVLILKALYPSLHIRVHADLCAGLTREKHLAALEVMRSCQVEVCNG